MSEQVHYCRVPLPEIDARGAKVYAAREAVSELLTIMEAANVDPATGQFSITYGMDSTLTREYVLAEWRPSK